MTSEIQAALDALGNTTSKAELDELFLKYKHLATSSDLRIAFLTSYFNMAAHLDPQNWVLQ